MRATEHDQSKVRALDERLLGILNGSAQALLISLGYKTGLFDTMAKLPASTSEQIAEVAGLNERYVREWLGGMVVSRLIDYDPTGHTYALPPEHAAVLSGTAGAGMMATHAQNIPVLLSAEPDLLGCFRDGGGLPFSAHPAFNTCVRVGGPVLDVKLPQEVLPLAPGLVERLLAGIDAADMGCGAGHKLNVMAQAFPRSWFTGYDLSEDGIAAGRAEAQRLGLTNAQFEPRDLTTLDMPDRFDLITAFDAIHDLPKPRVVLEGIHRALRPGGIFLMEDIRASSRLEENVRHPLGPYCYMWSLTFCMTGSLAQGGEGLGTMWGEQVALDYLAGAGFRDVVVKTVEGDLINSYYICTKQ